MSKHITISDENIDIYLNIKNKNISIFPFVDMIINTLKLEEVKSKKIIRKELLPSKILSKEYKNSLLKFLNELTTVSDKDTEIILNATKKEDIENNISQNLIIYYQNYELMIL